ncbi:MAG: PAS domain S-box protein [Lentisphaerae bacterium]|nr:PAS domain S-box protein [Lentisphaerota bacterium]
MTLRQKTMLWTTVLLIASMLGVYGIAQKLIIRDFLILEKQRADQRMESIRQLLQSELNQLREVNSDWSVWDDSYAFIQDGNPEFIEANLQVTAFRVIRVNLPIFMQGLDVIRYATLFDFSEETELPAPGELLETVRAFVRSQTADALKEGTTGLLPHGEKIYLVSAHAILPSSGEGDSRGAIVFCRLLSEAEIQRMAGIVLQPFSIVRLENPSVPEDIRRPLMQSRDRHPALIRREGPAQLTAYALLRDLTGRSLFVIQAPMPRPIYAQGVTLVRYFMVALYVVGTGLILVMLFLLGRMALNPLSRLSSEVKRIAQQDNLSVRLSATGAHELDTLVHMLNKLFEHLQQTQDSLRQSERKYRGLIETLQEGIWVVDRDACTTYVNPRMAAMLGYTAEAMLGKHLFDFMDERGKALCARNLERREQGSNEPHEFEFIRKRGDRIYTMIETVSITDEKDRYAGAISGVMDITDRKRTEQALMNSQKLEAIGVLAGGIAHDVSNIVMGIMCYGELALHQLQKAGLATDNVEEVLRTGRRAKALVDKILASRQTNKPPAESARIHVAVMEALNMLHASMPENIKVQCNLDPSCKPVRADPLQIVQLVMNLCTNARRAMRETGGILDVKLVPAAADAALCKAVAGLAPGPHVKLSVRDTGCGMSAETQAHIFEPFFTTREGADGIGLGLSVVKNIVAQLGGAIALTSAPGKGTLFEIYLPCEE